MLTLILTLNPKHKSIVGVGVGVGVAVGVGVGVGVISHSSKTSKSIAPHASYGVGFGVHRPLYIIVSSKSGQIDVVGFGPKK